MSVRFICPECHNAYRAGQMHGRLCPSCTHKVVTAAKQEQAKTELANDLVRGTSESGENPTS